MQELFKADAVVIAYDVSEVMRILKPLVRNEWSMTNRTHYLIEDQIIDFWFSHTIHQYEVVTVAESFYHDLNGHIAAFVSRTQEAISTLWRIIDIPVELSGSVVTIRRFRDVLWIVYLNANVVTTLPVRRHY